MQLQPTNLNFSYFDSPLFLTPTPLPWICPFVFIDFPLFRTQFFRAPWKKKKNFCFRHPRIHSYWMLISSFRIPTILSHCHFPLRAPNSGAQLIILSFVSCLLLSYLVQWCYSLELVDSFYNCYHNFHKCTYLVLAIYSLYNVLYRYSRRQALFAPYFDCYRGCNVASQKVVATAKLNNIIMIP